MERLVYSPKIYAFVQTERKRDPNVPWLDISDYIVSGNVQRVINAVSTAELVLRNPHRVWNKPADPVFHPMDKITLWMSRFRNRPVQVFTGYLDRTPYFQLFPGTVTLRASCTLKRLLNTYWDPALPATIKFLEKNGWYAGGSDGTITNLNELEKLLSDTGDGQLTDGSIGALLHSVLTEKDIGNWKSDQVFIEPLPAKLPQKAKNIYHAFDDDRKDLAAELETFLKNIIGSDSYGGGGTGGTVGLGRNPKDIAKIVEVSSTAAERWNVPLEMALAVSFIESSWGTNLFTHEPFHGWYQMSIDWAPYGSDGPKKVTVEQANNLEWAVNVWCRAASRRRPGNWQNKDAWLQWAEITQGVDGPNGDQFTPLWANATTEARKAISQWRSRVRTDSASASTSPDSSNVDNKRSGNADSASDGKIFAPIAGGTTTISSPYGEPNHGNPPHVHRGIDVPVPVGTDCVAPADGKIGAFAQTTGFVSGGMVHFVFTKTVGDTQAGTVIGWGHVSKVLVRPGESVKAGQVIAKSGYPAAPHVHFIERLDSNDLDGTENPTKLFTNLQNGKSSPTTGSGGGAADSGDNTLSNSKAAAFAVELAFPSIEEMTEAVALQGQKSLMNDKPLMPFIQQLTGASLRQFQSLPNGDFFAFFPDYFGTFEHRRPYWLIEDIEILNGQIELTDDNLATHVYVVGDTGLPLDGVNFVDKILTGGVITIFNAFESDFVLDRDSKSVIQGVDDAVRFLQKYGARPYYEEAPFVRSPYFEALLAFQKFQLMWSRTFLTEFELTFMPELFPGGIIELGNHGIQCYVDSVTHNFDYTSGFTTTAALSAPAATGKDTTGISQGMVLRNSSLRT